MKQEKLEFPAEIHTQGNSTKITITPVIAKLLKKGQLYKITLKKI